MPAYEYGYRYLFRIPIPRETPQKTATKRPTFKMESPSYRLEVRNGNIGKYNLEASLSGYNQALYWSSIQVYVYLE
jgi:hypothetical protein